MKSKINFQVLLLLGSTVILWASAYSAIRIGLQAYTPGALGLLRFLAASIVLGGTACFNQVRLPDFQDGLRVTFMALTGVTIYNIALCSGELTVEAGTASFLTATVPIFTVILAVIFLKEEIYLNTYIGVVVGFIGVAMITLGGSSIPQFTSAALLVLVAALAQSAYFILQKPLLLKYSALELVSYTVWLGMLSMLIFLPQLIQEMQQASFDATWSIVYLGIFPAAIANLTWAKGLSQTQACTASSFLYFVPIVAVFIAWIYLGEIPNTTAIVGEFISLLGILIINAWSSLEFLFRLTGKKVIEDQSSV
ncbi:MAG: DMT family transporter [Cyanobacteria bacterium P01_G01_bin.67]